MRRSQNSRLCRAVALLTLLLLSGSCISSGVGHVRGPKNEPEYRILSEAQADSLFRKIRSQNADIDTVQQFFRSNSFYLEHVQALRQGSRVACIALYSPAHINETIPRRVGILAIKLQGDAVVETIAGILWLENGFPNEIEGPKFTSTSTMSLCGWWSCVFNSAGRTCQLKGYGPYAFADWLNGLEAACGFPLVYYWFQSCY